MNFLSFYIIFLLVKLFTILLFEYYFKYLICTSTTLVTINQTFPRTSKTLPKEDATIYHTQEGDLSLYVPHFIHYLSILRYYKLCTRIILLKPWFPMKKVVFILFL